MPTKIAYVDETINPIRTKDGGWHCVKRSPGCLHCYAEKINKRFGDKLPYYESLDRKVELILNEKALEKPLHWKKPKRIFVQDMSDLFLDTTPTWMIDRILEVIAACPQHTFLMLTKRPENLEKKLYEVTPDNPCRELGGGDYFSNLHLGVTAENQEMADKRIPILLQIPGFHWVSLEPLLGKIDLKKLNIDMPSELSDLRYKEVDCLDGNFRHDIPFVGPINWVVCGGESGPGARPMNPDWARELRDQCVIAGIPFFFKSWGEYHERDLGMPPEFMIKKQVWFDGTCMVRVGKKAAGRLLDGKFWDQMPEPKP